MDKIIVKGGARLHGRVEVSGSKNASLPILAAALLGEGKSFIRNTPRLRDIMVMIEILESLGAKVRWHGHDTLEVDSADLRDDVAPYELVRKMRASICVLGPLLARFGKAKVSHPGGCIIGPRPVDLHLKGIGALHASVQIEHGYIIAEAKRLRGGEVFLGGRFGSSVLATANTIMAATKAQGTTVIESAACEPEVVDLARFLTAMGAHIEGAGTHVIRVTGVKKLTGAEHTVIPDRIEAGTHMVAAAVTKGDVRISGARIEHLRAVIDKLGQAGVSCEQEDGEIRVRRGGKLNVVDVITLPYPGFPTDMQAQVMALMAVTEGISVVTEKIYPERFMHVSELNRMAARISLEGNSAIVKGVRNLSGAPVMASDLRASAALILAGLVAEGETEVNRVYHIDRGYVDIEKKFAALGADIQRVSE